MCKKMRVEWLGCGLLLGCCAATAGLCEGWHDDAAARGGVVALAAGSAGTGRAGGDSGGARTRAEYTKAMDGFRTIYHRRRGTRMRLPR